jgi:hypothetical protein
MSHGTPRSAGGPGSLFRSVRAVAWSFLGVRRKSGLQDDLERVNPFHLIATALGGAILFVLGLIALVNWVVAP